MKNFVRPTLGIAVLVWSFSGHALVWPDIPAQVEHDLSSPDVAVRRKTAEKLRTLTPVRSGPLVLQALSDTDLEVRKIAAEAAVHFRLDASREAVLPWLGDREPALRLAACAVARAMPDPLAVAPLARALGDANATVRIAAADALGEQRSVDAVAPLLGKLDDPESNVRRAVALALARLNDPRAVVPLIGKVQDSAPDVRQSVARALGDLGDARASRALLLQIRDDVAEVKIEALSALAKLRSADAVDAIASLLNDRAPAVRFAAMNALGKIATEEAAAALLATLGTEDDGHEFEHTPPRDALVGAGAIAVPLLHTLLESGASPAVHASTAWILGHLKAQSEVPVIIRAMRLGSLSTASALQALSLLRDVRTLDTVLEFVSDDDPQVRSHALIAARALLDPDTPDGRAVEPLAAAISNAARSVTDRVIMAELLGRTGSPRAAPPLVRFLTSPERQLRRAAIEAIGLLGPVGVDDDLLKLLRDPDAEVRLHAAIAIGRAGGPTARESLLAMLETSEEFDRNLILTGLSGVLARSPSEGAVTTLLRRFELSPPGERDGLVVVLGCAQSEQISSFLKSIVQSNDIDARRAVATVLSTLANRPDARTLARQLLRDPNGSVRAQAAWTLGQIGDVSDQDPLIEATMAPDLDIAINATAALGRLGARHTSNDLIRKGLCPLIQDPRSYVKANALVAIASVGRECDGEIEDIRRTLRDDPSDVVRGGAAAFLQRAPRSPENERALARCASEDRNGAVARRCRSGFPTLTRLRNVDIYVLPEDGSVPKPRSVYSIEFADGFIRAGYTDRRGMIFEPNAPEGELRILKPYSTVL